MSIKGSTERYVRNRQSGKGFRKRSFASSSCVFESQTTTDNESEGTEKQRGPWIPLIEAKQQSKISLEELQKHS